MLKPCLLVQRDNSNHCWPQMVDHNVCEWEWKNRVLLIRISAYTMGQNTFTLSHSHDSSALFFPFQALGYLYLVYYYQNNRLTCSLGIFQPCLINSMSCIKDKANSGPVWHFRCTMVRWLIKKMLTPCSVVIFIEKQRISSMIDGPCLLGIIL